MLSSPSIWAWLLIVPHMIVIHLHSTHTLPFAGSTTLTLNLHNGHLPFMSLSNPRTSTPNLLIHISQGLPTSLNLISRTCDLHAKALLCPVPCRAQNSALVFPPLASSPLLEKTFSLYAM